MCFGSIFTKPAPADDDPQKIALISFAYPLSQSPGTVFLAETLAEKGYCVDIFMNKEGFFNVKFENPGIRVMTMGGLVPQPLMGAEEDTPAVKNSDLPQFPKNVLFHFIPTWIRLLTPFTLWLRRYWVQGGYLFVVAVESEALIVAAALNYLKAFPLIFYSMELRLSNEPDKDVETVWRVPKRLEKWAHKRARFTLIQDEYRALALAGENKVPLTNFLKVPEGMKGPQVKGHSDFLSKELGLPDGVKILLYIGNIAHWANILEIIEGIKRWPKSWIFVVHGFVTDREYIHRIKALSPPGRVFLSTRLLPYGNMDQLVLSADAGVALYPKNISNMRLTASASGKIAQYLKCRLPIIVNDFEHTRNMIETHKCGVCVKAPMEVGRALMEIEQNFDRLVTGTEDYYRQNYRMEPWLNNAIATIETAIIDPYKKH